jgi:hypothetical protein
MAKKLYRVDVVLYVMAETESVACAVATTIKFDMFECMVEKVKFLDPAWQDVVPYNADDERTCSEIFPNNKLGVPLTPSLMN